MTESFSEAKDRPIDPHKRPYVLSLICVLGFIGLPYLLMDLDDPELQRINSEKYGPNHMMISFVLNCLKFVAFSGFWLMRKWAIALFGSVAAIHFLYALLKHEQGLVLHIKSLAILIIALHFKDRMK